MERIFQSTDRMRLLVRGVNEPAVSSYLDWQLGTFSFTPQVEIASGRVGDLLHWTLDDLHVQFMLRQNFKLLWLTPSAFLMPIPLAWGFLAPYDNWKFQIHYKGLRSMIAAEGNEISHGPFDDQLVNIDLRFLHLYADSMEQAAPALEVLLYLMVRSEAEAIGLRGFGPGLSLLPISLEALERLVRSTHMAPAPLHWHNFSFDENQCRMLFSAASENMHWRFFNCILGDDGASLVRMAQANQGPRFLGFGIRLPESFIDFLAALRQNTSLTTLYLVNVQMDDRLVQALAVCLAENGGIKKLAVQGHGRFSFESWSQFWDSLHGNPVLKTLYFEALLQIPQHDKGKWTQRIVDMMKANTVLQHMDLDLPELRSDANMLRDEVEPRLEVNIFRPRVAALTQETNIDLRMRLLGAALAKVANNPTLIFMLLSGNHDLLSCSTRTHGNLPLNSHCANGNANEVANGFANDENRASGDHKRPYLA